MSHPSLGRPPRDLSAGFPVAADRIRAARSRLAGRALEVAVDRDPTMSDRLGELGLRRMLRNAEVYLDQVALSVAADDPFFVAAWSDQVSPVFRRRRIPMDDMINLSEGIRLALQSVLSPEERVPADVAVDSAIGIFRWYRRLAGDARKRNKILAFLYKGA